MNKSSDNDQVIDILKINRTTVNYKRGQLAIYSSSNEQDVVQLLLFDRAVQLSEYDSIIGFKNLLDQFGTIINEDAVEKFNQLLLEGKKEIQLCIPFTQWTISDTSMINMIENELKQKIKITLTSTGDLLSSNYVMRRISQLENLASSYRNLEIYHDLNYSPYCINVDKYQNCCIDFLIKYLSTIKMEI